MLQLRQTTRQPRPQPVKTAAQSLPTFMGDPSILEVEVAAGEGAVQLPNLGNLIQVLSSTRYKLAEARREFWTFVLPNGDLLEPRQRETLAKQAIAAILPPQSVAVPQQ